MTLFPEKMILTVSRLTSIIRNVMEENFENVWVEGEVSNFAAPGSGHIYFTLKDSAAQIRCVMFRSSVRMLRFQPKDGMGLVVRGRMTVFEQRGEYQLLVDYLEPKGVGALQTAFIQLKERLEREGLFHPDRKKTLPLLPQCVGVVTSPDGAAIHDILQVIDRRFADMTVVIRPVRVQGEGAALEIAEGIRDLNRCGGIDVIIVGRGGGSLEDLWAFNEEIVAREIFASRIPVISAVGHETDFTISDFVADLRAPTPSAAAEIVVKSKEELLQAVESLSHRLRISILNRVEVLERRVEGLARCLKEPTLLLGRLSQQVDYLRERLVGSATGAVGRREERLDFLATHLRLVNPALRIERTREQLISLLSRTRNSIRVILDGKRQSVAVGAGKLHSLSPLLTLARGYAVPLRLPERSGVRDSGAVAAGDLLEIILHRGSIVCRVEESRKENILWLPTNSKTP